MDRAVFAGDVEWSSTRPARGDGNTVPGLLEALWTGSEDEAAAAAEELEEMVLASGWTFAFARVLVPHVGRVVQSSATTPPWQLFKILGEVAAHGESAPLARLEITPLADPFGFDDEEQDEAPRLPVTAAEAQAMTREALEALAPATMEVASPQQKIWLAYALSGARALDARWTAQLRGWTSDHDVLVSAAAILALGLAGTATVTDRLEVDDLRSLAAQISQGLAGDPDEGRLAEAVVRCLEIARIPAFPWGGRVGELARRAAQRHCERNGIALLLRVVARLRPEDLRLRHLGLVDDILRLEFPRLIGGTRDVLADELTEAERSALTRIADASGGGVWLGLGLPATHDVGRFLGTSPPGPLDVRITWNEARPPIWWVLRGIYRGRFAVGHVLDALESQLPVEGRFALALDIASGAYRTRRADTCLGNARLDLLASLVARLGAAVAVEASAYAQQLIARGGTPTFAECAVAAIPLVVRSESVAIPLGPEEERLAERASRIWKRE